MGEGRNYGGQWVRGKMTCGIRIPLSITYKQLYQIKITAKTDHILVWPLTADQQNPVELPWWTEHLQIFSTLPALTTTPVMLKQRTRSNISWHMVKSRMYRKIRLRLWHRNISLLALYYKSLGDWLADGFINWLTVPKFSIVRDRMCLVID